MSCRRASRELLDRFRFGEELDARSDPHLAHLQVCLECRAAVGLDQALIAQLRRALRARVDGPGPSPDAWRVVRDRVSAPLPAPLWSRLTRWTRLVPAGAAMLLMVVAVSGARDVERGGVAQPWTWPSLVSERDADAPDPQLPWYIRDRPPPPISAPAGGPTAGAEPAEGAPMPAPSPVLRVLP